MEDGGGGGGLLLGRGYYLGENVSVYYHQDFEGDLFIRLKLLKGIVIIVCGLMQPVWNQMFYFCGIRCSNTKYKYKQQKNKLVNLGGLRGILQNYRSNRLKTYSYQ